MAEHKMTSMKMSKKEAKAENSGEMDQPEYPYGLSLHLDDEALSKLGMKTLPTIDTTMSLNAKVKVTEVTEHSQSGEKKMRRSVSLQITDMELYPEGKEKSKEEALYGN